MQSDNKCFVGIACSKDYNATIKLIWAVDMHLLVTSKTRKPLVKDLTPAIFLTSRSQGGDELFLFAFAI